MTLSPNTTYYILSQETQAADSWCDLDTAVQTTGDAALNGPVYGAGSPFVAMTGAGHLYVPVDFKYGFATSVHVGPATASLSAGQNQQFTANASVSWSITPSVAGTISASGLYTAPASIPNQQTVTVTATAWRIAASRRAPSDPASAADFVLSRRHWARRGTIIRVGWE